MDWRLPLVLAALVILLATCFYLAISLRISHGIEAQLPVLEAPPR